MIKFGDVYEAPQLEKIKILTQNGLLVVVNFTFTEMASGESFCIFVFNTGSMGVAPKSVSCQSSGRFP